MTAKNLSTVTTGLIASYGNTAKNVINAYRLGGERVVGFMDQSWERALEKSAPRLSDEVRANALSAQKKLSGYTARGISLTTDGADTLVDKAVELAEKGVAQAVANADRFEKATGVTTLNTIATAAVPAAEAAGKLASKIEEQSSLLAQRVSGKSKPAVKVAAVKRTVKAKAARVRKAVAA
jgi:hypothetical protein